MKRTTVTEIKRMADWSITVTLSNGAKGNFDRLSQGYDWACDWCGVNRNQYKKVQQEMGEELWRV